MKQNQATKVSLSVIDYDTFQPVQAEDEYYNNRDFVGWGYNNTYPQYLWDVYSKCATLQSVLNGCADFTYGKGIVNNTNLQDENIFGDTIPDIVDKIILDRWIFGGFALQIKYNQLGDIISLAHLDFRKCRIDKELQYVFVNDKWAKWGSNRYEKFSAFNPETGAADGVQIYFYRGARTRGVYPIPDYAASLVSCETQIKAKSFNYNELCNNFSGTAVVNFNNGVPADEVKKEIEHKLNSKFTGDRNAGRMLVTFNEDKEHAVTIERIATDDLPDRYNNLSTESRADIFVALRAHPQLFGMSVPTGFADIEYSEAFNLLNETHIAKKQSEIIRVFNKIFAKTNAIEFNKIEQKKIEEEK